MTSDDILARLGLQARNSTTDYLFPAFGLFGAGLVVGAGIALLLAPKAGRELRSDVADRAHRLRERLSWGNAAASRAPEDMSRDELYEQAQAMGIAGRSEMSKAELLEAVTSH